MPANARLPLVADAPPDRADPRITVLIRTVKLVAGNRDFIAVLLDVSRTGLQLKLFKQLPAGLPITLELESRQQVSLQLRWQKADHAGFSFAKPISPEELLRTGDRHYPHRPVRLRYDAAGEVLCQGQHLSANFVNLSQSGACFTTSAYLAVGQLISIVAPGLSPHFAKVRWRKAPHYGVVFEEVLTMPQLAGLVCPDLPDAGLQTDPTSAQPGQAAG